MNSSNNVVSKSAVRFDIDRMLSKKESSQIAASSTLPVDNINLCFVGGVSTGKSTILNAIFCEELTQCKIKRTTMVPTVYVENENDAPNLDEPSKIFEQIAQKNKEIIEKTESGATVADSEYAVLQFQVGKLDINILPDSYVNVYDIPGLNDARTKSVYYKYLQSNFFKFNLVVFIVDIHSGLNTSDEADILNFIADHTRQQYEANNKKIYTLVVVNKADDMQFSEDDTLEITGELGEMFDQVENAVTEAFKERDIADHLIGIIPLCAVDSYLYRMTQKHGDKFKLSPEQILKIGINENGKKFSTLKPKTQEAKVREILNDSAFIDTMIKLSGFGQFEKRLRTFLSENNTGAQIRIDNLLFELHKLPSLSNFVESRPGEVENIASLCESMFNIFNAVLKIDAERGNAMIGAALAEITESLTNYLSAYGPNANISYAQHVIAHYNKYRDLIFAPYFKGHVNSSYPKWLQNIVFGIVKNQFIQTRIPPVTFMTGFDLCRTVGAIPMHSGREASAKAIGLTRGDLISECASSVNETAAQFETLTNSILHNDSRFSAIIMDDVSADNAHILEFVAIGESLGVNMTTFLRFVLLNRICSGQLSDETLFQKRMLCLKYGEIPIYSYLSSLRVSPEWALRGLTVDILEDPAHELDIEYLVRECSKK